MSSGATPERTSARFAAAVPRLGRWGERRSELRSSRAAHVSGVATATYPHLHFEFRKGGPEEARSVHPLNYLPYTNTANFTQLRLGRCNFYRDGVGEKRSVRLCFDLSDRLEGDLQGVDVKLKAARRGAGPSRRLR